MRTHRGTPLLTLLLALTATPACDAIDRVRGGAAQPDTAAAGRQGLVLSLQVPGMLRAGEEGSLRLSVTNRADTAATQVRLELVVPGWVEPMPPRAGDREVSMAALPGGATRFTYRMDDTPIQAGQTQTIVQRIRVPGPGATIPAGVEWTRTVRARLVAPDGEALAEVASEVSLDPATMPDTTQAIAAPPRGQLGSVRLGMTTAELRTAAPDARDTTWSQEGMTERGVWVPVEGGRALAVLSGDTVMRIEARDAALRTREGLGIGSRLGDLRAAYGTTCVGIGEGIVVVWFSNAPGVSFALDTPVPQNVAEIQANPERLPDTARVTRWWLRGDEVPCPRGP